MAKNKENKKDLESESKVNIEDLESENKVNVEDLKSENNENNSVNESNSENDENKLTEGEETSKDTNSISNEENALKSVSEPIEDKEPLVTCLFLINVKYNKLIKGIGESIELLESEALFLESNGIVQIVR